MASTSGQEEFLAVIRKSQEAVLAVVRNLAETAGQPAEVRRGPAEGGAADARPRRERSGGRDLQARPGRSSRGDRRMRPAPRLPAMRAVGKPGFGAMVTLVLDLVITA